MKLKLLVLFCIVQVITGHYIPDYNLPDKLTRIVGGEIAEDGSATYQCSLQLWSSHICGCSIISSEWILTAAHCVNGIDAASLRVLVGTNDLLSVGTYYNVARYIKHENYGSPPSQFSNDIAVIRVGRSIEFNDKVQPIEYSAEEVPADTVLTLTGWGRLYANGPIPRNLQILNSTSISLSDCQNKIGNEFVQPSHLCTLNTPGQGFCAGDSGGPLVLNNKVVGVVNFGHIVCGNGVPNMFANVAYLYDWIKDNTK